ncbi:hypothetical protein [Helicobacter mustelae]
MRMKQEALEELLYVIPNIPDEKTPRGEDERENLELSKILEPRAFDFIPKEHWELAQQNGWIDFERGVKLAKSRFSVLRGMGARLNRALINFMLDCNQKAGFELVWLGLVLCEIHELVLHHVDTVQDFAGALLPLLAFLLKIIARQIKICQRNF